MVIAIAFFISFLYGKIFDVTALFPISPFVPFPHIYAFPFLSTALLVASPQEISIIFLKKLEPSVPSTNFA